MDKVMEIIIYVDYVVYIVIDVDYVRYRLLDVKYVIFWKYMCHMIISVEIGRKNKKNILVDLPRGALGKAEKWSICREGLSAKLKKWSICRELGLMALGKGAICMAK